SWLHRISDVTRIISTATAVPPFTLTSDELKRLCALVYPDRERAAARLIDNTRIAKRHLVRPATELMMRRSLTEKTAAYRRMSFALCEAAARRALRRAHRRAEEVDLVVTTSCTGVMIPSVDAYLVEALHLRRDVVRLP